MAAQTSSGDHAGPAPVACSLTSADLAAQTGRWERLAARTMIDRAETAHGVRISFRPEPGAEEELRRLVAVEHECCRWADWTVEATAGQLILDVRSSGEGVGALHSMFTGLQPARTGHR